MYSDDYIMTVIYKFIDLVINNPVEFTNTTFTNNSANVTGTGFMSTITAGKYIKSASSDYWYTVSSVISNTQLTLTELFKEPTAIQKMYYSTTGIDIIRSNQNVSIPSSDTYLIIQKPFAVRKRGLFGNWGMANTSGVVNYTTHWEATISIEEEKSTGEYLRKLVNSLNRQDIKDFFYKNYVSVLTDVGIKPLNMLLNNEWEDRAILDLYILFTDQDSYTSGYIENAEITGTY